MASSWHLEDKPFATWALSNNSAEIRRVKDRIKSFHSKKEIGFVGWEFDGGKVEANTEANRLANLFEDKPDEATREALVTASVGRQKQGMAAAATSNAYYAADYVKAIAPPTGKSLPSYSGRISGNKGRCTGTTSTGAAGTGSPIRTKTPFPFIR